MTLPNRADLIIEQGKTFKWWFAVRYPDGAIADLPAVGYTTARMQVRALTAEGGLVAPPVLTLTTANGGIVLGSPPIDDGAGMTWTGYLYASPATTATLLPWGVGLYDLEIDNGSGDVLAVLRGTAVLEREATYGAG